MKSQDKCAELIIGGRLFSAVTAASPPHSTIAMSAAVRAQQLVLGLESEDSATRLQVSPRALCGRGGTAICPAAPGQSMEAYRSPPPQHRRQCLLPPVCHTSLLSALCPRTAAPSQALRGIKNCVIGNKRQKLQYIQLGAVQLLVGVLASPAADPPALVQAATALGSFVASEEGLQVVLSHGGIPHLLRVLVASEDGKVVEAAARALKTVARVSPAQHSTAGDGRLCGEWACCVGSCSAHS